jgi:hypothetical protein
LQLLGSCGDRRDAMQTPGVGQVAGTADRLNIADFGIVEFPGSTAFIPHFQVIGSLVCLEM